MPRTSKGTTKDAEDVGNSTEKGGAEQDVGGVNSTLTEQQIIDRLEAKGTATALSPSQIEGLIHPEKMGPKPPTIKPLPPLGKESKPVAVKDIKNEQVYEDDLPFPASTDVKAVEAAQPVPDPFADIDDPDVLFLINEWGATENERIIVRAEVDSVTLKSTVKRGDFSRDQFDIQEHIIPKNLTANLVIDHVPAKIAETGSDASIINEFLQHYARELDDVTVGIVKRRTDAQQTEAREELAEKLAKEDTEDKTVEL